MGSVSLKSRSSHPGAKFCLLSDWLVPMLKTHRPCCVVFESPLMVMPRGKGQSSTMMALIGYPALVQAICCRLDIAVTMASASTVRKHFLGHGRPDDPKAAVMAECRRRGWQPVDHNAADAAALWDYSCFLAVQH